jgi:phage/plasmid primase-like uncharacterized protein
MTSLISIFGGEWSPPPPRQFDPPDLQLYKAISDAGLEPPDDIYLDGTLRRFKSGTKGKGGHGDKTGWYIAFADGVPAGRFGCWRAGVEQTWRADVGRSLTPAEEMAHARRMAEAKARRDEELKRSREVAADTVEKIWQDCTGASPEHPYLARKGIGAHGARVTGDGRLVVPLYDSDGKISSLQYIAADGQKLYHPGGQTGGCFWSIGALESAPRIYIAEGFATAATIHEVTGCPVVIAYSASNLVPVTGSIRCRFESAKVVIVADNDASGVGQRYAEQASAKYGATVIVPPMLGGDANDYRLAGHDLALLLDPPPDPAWLIPADQLAAQPAPINWLVKHWLQAHALIMVHGPSGGGKTFAVLDWCLRLASGMSDWCGHRIHAGPVIYLAGEGHHGLRGRIAAWKQHHRAGKLAMHMSASGCDLNTATGLHKAIDAIRTLPDAPKIIVVDTLHRFLAGDENSAQDAKTMLDACAHLMREFHAAVLLVHHTGVSEESQHRARGSSAWRGALDIEISVVPGDESRPMELIQRKSKDAELAKPVYLKLQSVAIDGWMDEDGEQVTSAIVVQDDAPIKPVKDTRLSDAIKLWSAAWWHAGAEVYDGVPYLSRDGLKGLLVERGMAQKTISNHLSPGDKQKTIGSLVAGEVIAAHAQGWLMLDNTVASTLLMQKNSPAD